MKLDALRRRFRRAVRAIIDAAGFRLERPVDIGDALARGFVDGIEGARRGAWCCGCPLGYDWNGPEVRRCCLCGSSRPGS
jgi:hypothetical protein